MTSINRFEFPSDKQITAQIADTFDSFLWIAYDQNDDGNCILKKVSINNPNQIYFTIERPVNKIIAMDTDASGIYVAYEDATLLGERFTKTNPLTNTTEIPRGIIAESPVDIIIDFPDLWFLLPGNASGTNAKLLRYNTNGTLEDTVDLIKSDSTVVNAKTMTIDDNGDIWIGTNTDPATVVRVFDTGGQVYDFEVTEII